MDTKALEEHIRALAMLPETDDPIISCYAAVENNRVKDPNRFEEQICALQVGLKGEARRSFEDALDPVRSFLANRLPTDAKGVAVFSRAGQAPYFLFLRFRVPLPNWIAVGKLPSIFHLVELKDTYERYVVMLSTKERVRIFEVNLGELTEHTCIQASNPRRDVRDKWSKEHYQRHVRESHHRFIKEQIKILEHLMEAGNHRHLILAGHPTMTAKVREELPKGLAAKLVEVVKVSEKGPLSGVVQATIKVFVDAEERASQGVAESLAQQVHAGGLAVIGTKASFEALRRSQADTLVLLGDYNPGPAWACRACKYVDLDHRTPEPSTCRSCGADGIDQLDLKEEMVRLAEQHYCAVEVVNKSDFLMEAGGIGCLLRYRFEYEN
jgi:protein required for attachment to host cells